VYHLTIRGANLGSYDGIDAVGENYWIHDNEVSLISIRSWRTQLTLRRSPTVTSAFA
jgi:hypothetical protein